MTRTVAVLRPQPGNRATIDRLRAAGLATLSLPLFEIASLRWTPPPGPFDRLLLTSANAVRHGGPRLALLRALPVLAVGEATAHAAREAGFTIAATGAGDAATLLRDVDPHARLLWLAGEDRSPISHSALHAVPVYRAAHRPLTPPQAAALVGGVALLHSARAAQALANEVDGHGIARADICLAAISAAVAQAAGPGWAACSVAMSPDDDALIDAARPLAIDP